MHVTEHEERTKKDNYSCIAVLGTMPGTSAQRYWLQLRYTACSRTRRLGSLAFGDQPWCLRLRSLPTLAYATL